MSQSKPATGSKAKAKSKTAGAAKRDAVETVRIIPAQSAPELPALTLSAADKERSEAVRKLAADIESALAVSEQAPAIDPAAAQALIAAMCRVYSQHSANGISYDAFSHKNPVTPTDVMVTASGLLKASNLAVFELGMWQSWTGR
jgi:hypothetical protein